MDMQTSDKGYLYEAEANDYVLDEGEEKIMRAMRRLDKLWQQYGGRMFLFAGTSVSVRMEGVAAQHEIESFPSIKNDGGDGSDRF